MSAGRMRPAGRVFGTVALNAEYVKIPEANLDRNVYAWELLGS